ncbi:MAG: hypothetical protein SPJ92_09395 [Bariatricus sp.]|nr:hypothetical protein [Bariatricus sp.]
MSTKTKIVVLHMKEIIYTAVFVVLGILILCLLFFMFSSKSARSGNIQKKYNPGVYTSNVQLGSTDLEVEVAVDETRITSIRISNLSESVSAMYPLLRPAIEDIANQICEQQSLENIELSSDTPYTSKLLLNAIDEALKKAVVS